MSSHKLIILGVCATMAVMIEGNAFLKAHNQHISGRISAQDVQTTLLEEIEASLGAGIASKRIADIHAVLDPMFASLPKNHYGNLEHSTVRYALHRVFVQRHGWSITGLDPGGEAWNASSPTGVLKDQVSSLIQNMFEERLQGRGLGVHELVIFAATIEHLIHNEAIGRLGAALTIHKMLPTALLTEAEADLILDTYMMAYILSVQLPSTTLQEAKQYLQEMPELFLMWGETQAFVRQVRQNVSATVKGSDAKAGAHIDFATLVKVAETVGEQFGTFQDAECKGLKSQLTKIEDRGSGRVRLSDFYKPALGGQETSWQFSESTGYLRQLGALDESNSDQPRVIMTNYLISSNNCIASSDYYSVCCINECEGLMSHLEKSIASPEATPERILELISSLPSSSVTAPRTLSATLLSRLQDIAAEHGGTVQLHGRLFAQWMHHAYPRECPFPHIAGTTRQSQPGDDSTATQEELEQFGRVTSNLVEIDDHHDLMMWSHEEELLAARPKAGVMSSLIRGVVYIVVLVCMVSMSSGYVQTAFGASNTKGTSGLMGKSEKYMV